MSRAKAEICLEGEKAEVIEIDDPSGNFEFDQRPDSEKLAELQRRGLVPARLRVVAGQGGATRSLEEFRGDLAGRTTSDAVPAAVSSAPASFPASFNAGAPVDLDRPATASRDDAVGERLYQLAKDLQDALDKKRKRARKELAAIFQRIEAQEAKCVEPSIDDRLQQIDLQRQKLVMSCGVELAERLREEQAGQRDLESFRQKNNLSREPHYPASSVLAAAVLLVLVLVEAGLNSVLFADASAHGLLGGWTEAIVLAIANVGLAFLLGFYGLRGLNGRGVFRKLAVGVLVAAGLGAVIGLNLFGAHYRDFKAELAKAERPRLEAPGPVEDTIISFAGGSARAGAAAMALASDLPPRRRALPGNDAETGVRTSAAPLSEDSANAPDRASHSAERAAIERALSAPWDIRSFNGIFLFVIGLCAALLALADGYRLDDPFPGYGRRHRRLMHARERSQVSLGHAMKQATTLSQNGFDAVGRTIQDYAREVQALKSLHDEYASQRKSWEDKLREEEYNRLRELEHFRMSNKLAGPPFAAGTGWLPEDLPDQQVKLLKAHEKALRKLHQRVGEERGKLLALFTGATAQFQTVFEDFGRVKLGIDLRGNANTGEPAALTAVLAAPEAGVRLAGAS